MEQDDAKWLDGLEEGRSEYWMPGWVGTILNEETKNRLLFLARECLMLRAKEEDRKRSGSIVVSQEDKEWLESLESTMDLVEQNDNITFKGLAPEAFRRLLGLAKK